jgi:DNA-binding transcriptional MocR family regulator
VAGTPEVIDRLAALKRFSDLSSSLLLQAVILDFIERGELDQHLATVRAALLRKHTLVQEALTRHLQGFATWTRPEGGYALWVTFPPQVDSRTLAVAARDAGVLVAPGFLFDPDGAPGSSVRLAVSCVQEDEIGKGIEVLARAARSLAERRSPPVPVFL